MLFPSEGRDEHTWGGGTHIADNPKIGVASLAQQLFEIEESISYIIPENLIIDSKTSSILEKLFPNELRQARKNLVTSPCMSLNQLNKQLQILKQIYSEFLSLLNIEINKLPPLDNKIKKGDLMVANFSPSLLNILESSKEKASQINVKYYTPFALLALLESSNDVVECFNKVREGLAEELIEKLNYYFNNTLPNSTKKEIFREFRWEELEFVRQSFIYAQQDKLQEISEKHLLLGILDGQSKTVKAMKDFFVKNNLSFDLLVNNLKIISIESTKKLDTPDAEEIFSESSDTLNYNNNLDTPDTDKIF